MERKRPKDANFLLGMRPNSSHLHWLLWNPGSQFNNLCFQYLFRTHESTQLFARVHCRPLLLLAGISCFLHTGRYRLCLLCVCTFLWWSPVRRKVRLLPNPTGCTCSDFWSTAQNSGIKLDSFWATCNSGGIKQKIWRNTAKYFRVFSAWSTNPTPVLSYVILSLGYMDLDLLKKIQKYLSTDHAN